ncbi:hypothetical protein PUNSTDRAFT_138731 [Punctularia strigosozonata HHB-11173 SS5]|uniref:RING-type domain-containing protein n=1 Tax=Punctularia strigosozonata (strain HHB-11173) TaxID=741275 RepID=R7S1R8_PUNST|nr:uncharacterized protein PUNSTDRAFT_138731 [Punctularia strigosozonata HHB-11173 SS5]EIN04335.1 hypothetical protein PUNSTDRAFT_138731 [Punctularia strigosozonata HHB-11173 SS5]
MTCEDDLRPGVVAGLPTSYLADATYVSSDDSNYFVCSSVSSDSCSSDVGGITETAGSCSQKAVVTTKIVDFCSVAATISTAITATTVEHSSLPARHICTLPLFGLADYEDRSIQLEVAKDEAVEARKAVAAVQEESVQAQEHADVAQKVLLQARGELMQARQHLQPLVQMLSQIEEDLQCQICMQIIRYPVILKYGHSFCQSCIATWFANSLQGIAGFTVYLFTNQHKSVTFRHSIILPFRKVCNM